MNADARVHRELQRLRGNVRFDEPLSRYGTYRIGGPAMALLRARDEAEIAGAVRLAVKLQLPLLTIGLGSNVLFHDDGFEGIVVRVANDLASCAQSGPEGSEWTVGAGFPIPRLARRSATLGHAGVQRLVGVPGAVGGGIYMNAGAHQQEFSQVVRSVSVIDRAGEAKRIAGHEIDWAYRRSGLVDVIVGATLVLEPSDPLSVKRELMECLKRRRAGTPFDQPCCGSVFRNPPAEHLEGLNLPMPQTAGRLIEAAGLKGFRVGGAEVSTMHANYVINTGGATAADVKEVVSTIRARVREGFGITLHREVQFVGTTGFEASEDSV